MAPIPQRNYTSPNIDKCFTPPEMTRLIYPYLKERGFNTIWECAAGAFDGDQLMANELRELGFVVYATDIVNPPFDKSYHDFLMGDPPSFIDLVDVIVTNVPFKDDYKFIAKANEYGLPWAFVTKDNRDCVARCASELYEHGHPRFERINPIGRCSFKMSNGIGWGCIGAGSPQFATVWNTRGLDIGYTMISVPYIQENRHGIVDIPIDERKKIGHQFVELFWWNGKSKKRKLKIMTTPEDFEKELEPFVWYLLNKPEKSHDVIRAKSDDPQLEK